MEAGLGSSDHGATGRWRVQKGVGERGSDVTEAWLGQSALRWWVHEGRGQEKVTSWRRGLEGLWKPTFLFFLYLFFWATMM